jgi:hypothetical protein
MGLQARCVRYAYLNSCILPLTRPLDQPSGSLKHLSPRHPILPLELGDVFDVEAAKIPVQVGESRIPGIFPLDLLLWKPGKRDFEEPD